MLFAAARPLDGGGASTTDAARDAAQRWSQLNLRGGTDAAFAPPIGYLQHILAPTLQRLLPHGIGLSIELQRRGFYPKGGGVVKVRARALEPGSALPALDVARRGKVIADCPALRVYQDCCMVNGVAAACKQGTQSFSCMLTASQVTRIRAHAFSAGRVPQSDAQRMAAAAAEELQESLGGAQGPVLVAGPSIGTLASPAQTSAVAAAEAVPTASEGSKQAASPRPSAHGCPGDGSSSSSSSSSGVLIEQALVREGDSTAVGDGGGLLLVAESDTGCLWGASALWERGKPPGTAGREAAQELVAALASGACVDQW